MKGRRPKPTALKLLQGNAGHRKIDTLHEPQAVIGLGSPPDHLSASARLVWFDLGPQLVKLGTLGLSDAGLFGNYCQAAADNRWYGVEVERLRTLRRRNGKQENRLLTYDSKRTKAAAAMQKIGAEFGIGASSRTRIKVPHDDGQGELPLGQPDSAFARAQSLAHGA